MTFPERPSNDIADKNADIVGTFGSAAESVMNFMRLEKPELTDEQLITEVWYMLPDARDYAGDSEPEDLAAQAIKRYEEYRPAPKSPPMGA